MIHFIIELRNYLILFCDVSCYEERLLFDFTKQETIFNGALYAAKRKRSVNRPITLLKTGELE